MSTSDSSVDVVVAGSGIAGLVAALAASELGLVTVVLEKASRLGGTTAVGNGLWVGCNSIARAAGIDDSLADVIAYLRFIGGGQTDEEKLLALATESPRALDFLTECGVTFQVTQGLADHYWGVAPGASEAGRHIEATLISESEISELGGWVLEPFDHPTALTLEEEIAWGGIANRSKWDHDTIAARVEDGVHGRGVALIIHLVKQLQARSVKIVRGEGVSKLLLADGGVVGVETTGGRRLNASAGVVLATGGYASEPRLAARFESVPGWASMYPPSHTGDAILMATRAGAAMKVLHNTLGVILGFNVPLAQEREAPAFRLAGISEMLCPSTIVVNRHGRRFGDETSFQALAPALREFDPLVRKPVNLPCFLIFDDQYAEAFSFAGASVGAPIPEWVSRAETLEDLAEALGIDPGGLARTVDRFNAFARSGLDEDFRRPSRAWTLARRESWGNAGSRNPSLGALERPPFYGLALHPSGFVSAGLATNRHGQVLDYSDTAIPGLYAAGDAAAKDDHGIGYQAGCSIASGMTFGYLAAHHLATQESRSRPAPHHDSRGKRSLPR